jgi:hypothetical protein
MNLLERARSREPEWTVERSDRVFGQIQKTQRNRRALSIALSSMVGVAILVLAVHALGASMQSTPSMGPPATYALDGGGG